MGDNDSAISDNEFIDHSNEITFHPSHPYYLSPSDNPGLMLVAKQFNGTCFGAWRRAIIIVLSTKKKIGFINGSFPQPAPTSPLLDQWEQVNHMVISWILNSLDPEIAQSLIFTKTAKGIWDELN
ncbi:uncharacterized protein LOC142165429 [Nicotiana tabacum]|uniref:Uncharacterized protein LOC142165429 n=2 Tax=Nicotiana TaxID=4085 RepID=A0AC58S530_TOBAC|nr:PREDICTED: uncharacterized protein LOC104212346 [Nicotiana sylvestris]